MASTQTIEIIKATVPVLEEHGTAITKVFYKNMFIEHPELLDIFNETNQKLGRQQNALASTVLAAAKNIEHLAVLLPQVTGISHKHRALQILPEHYPIVGKHLIGAIKQVLGEAANDDIINAWTEAYDEIANVFIQLEKDMYKEEMWQGFTAFKVIEKVAAATDIAAFTVVPVDSSQNIDLSTLNLTAGQYITVKTNPKNSEHLALRHYSLYSARTDNGIQFAVRRDNRDEHRGLVSNYLHDDLQVGDTVSLSAPAGDFALNKALMIQNDIPLVLISAGVGVTPILSMLEAQVAANPKRPIIWVYACQNKDHHAFNDETHKLLASAANVKKHIFYFEDGQLLDNTWLATLPKPADVYVCGSMPFMESIIDGLMTLEHGVDSVHYEPFGPKMSLQAS
ncbi:globin domain-containing protein [Psychrobacter aquaticus]|uniref:nitric oxide dioxygenase n=1 Tax=Psychrobacter aquaticus CMS 56 TaxID=1354303 RepID=U4T9S0_9GAMM|nr:globin domain-containing protein [Psychrobacter aquaticus]ERL55228.1 Flavohemoprotein (Hemoglobin-like protein) (Flavohemoglobin) (Nitric oxide dioxygenase) [Psychrobacter aquaticus CMS 56]